MLKIIAIVGCVYVAYKVLENVSEIAEDISIRLYKREQQYLRKINKALREFESIEAEYAVLA